MPAKKILPSKIPITVEQVDADGFHIFCKITVGGKRLRAIIDTGASKTVFSNKLIDTIEGVEIFNQGENMAAGIGEGDVKTEIALIPRINLGRKQVRDLYVGVMNFDHIDAHYKIMGIKPFDVIIGGDILSAKQCSINYAEQVLIVM